VPVATLIVALIATGASVLFLQGRSDPAPETAAAAGLLPPATERVVRGDLVEEVRAIGPIRFSGERSVVNRLPGVLTWVPPANTRMGPGKQLYAVDDRPVILLQGDLPAWREFAPGMAAGRDVLALEENLVALGYTGFTVDEEFSEKTANAVKRWQKTLGLPDTGKLELGRIVFASGPVRVVKAVTRAGDQAQPGSEVLRISGVGRQVDVEIPIAEQELAVKGAAVTILLPDGSETGGKVASVGATRLDKEGKSVVPLSVRFSNADASKDVHNTEVIVVLKRVEARNVLSVPVTALLPGDRGGYAVQVVRGDDVHLVPVTTGSFADGRAEVTGPGIAEGVSVGVPKL
jgi:hypothetical protein